MDGQRREDKIQAQTNSRTVAALPANEISPRESAPKMIKGLRYFAAIGLALLIVAGFGLRLYRPAADPPSWLYVYNTDEGHYSYNAYNKTKTGHWFVDEAKYALITPLFSLAQYLVAGGLPEQPNIVRYRAISILSGILFCLALRYLFGPPFIGWTAAALGSVSFMGVVHSRVGIPEMMLTLLLLVTALLAIAGEKRRSFILTMATGFTAVACAAIKLTGALMLPIVIVAPLLCRALGRRSNTYFAGIAAGALLGVSAVSLIVVVPYYADWLSWVSLVTSVGRGAVAPDLAGLLASLFSFLLSPALQTMPILWPMALCWCICVFLPRLKNGENDFEETLIFLWLGFGIVLLGLPSYQPARWQLMIFPPVIAAGFRFLLQVRRFTAVAAALALAVTLSATFSGMIGGGVLRLSGEIYPGEGMLSHIVTFAVAASAFSLAVVAARIFRMGWRTGVLAGVVLLELSVQFMLHAAYMKPAYSRETQWAACAGALERLKRSDNDLFAGSMVQDLSLRADIRVLPTYYVLEKDQLDDRSVRDFFLRQNQRPDYFLLLDLERSLWTQKAPLFMESLEAIGRCRLLIGDLGIRELHVYRVSSYDWLS